MKLFKLASPAEFFILPVLIDVEAHVSKAGFTVHTFRFKK